MIIKYTIAILLLIIILLMIFCAKLYYKLSKLREFSKNSINYEQKSLVAKSNVDNAIQDNAQKDLESNLEIENLRKEIDVYKAMCSNIQIATSLYSDKTLKSVCLSVNGYKNGEERIYFKGSAFLNKIRNWNKGVLDGISTTFYKTGEKYIEANYKEGKLNENYIVYNKDGSIKESYLYKNGERK